MKKWTQKGTATLMSAVLFLFFYARIAVTEWL